MNQIRKHVREIIYFTALLGIASAGAATNPYFNPDKKHHTPSGFRNNYADRITQSLPTIVGWQWDAWRKGLPPAPEVPTPVVPADLTALNGYARDAIASLTHPDAPTVTWIGHATTLVQAGGLNILTDPMFSERAFPVQFAGPRRAQPAGIALADLPPIDVVLVSHNHLDHLDKASVVQLHAMALQRGGTTRFLVPLGLKPLLQRWGIETVDELDWWSSVSVRGTDFFLTPTQHWSARGLGDESETLWGAWAVFSPSLHWYFAGDTGYSQDFADTKMHFHDRQTDALGGGFDLALIPIGAYEPRWLMQKQHVNPTEALQMHRDLGAKHSIGIHWGTFPLSDEPLDQAPKDLAKALNEAGLQHSMFSTLAIGETFKVKAR